MPEATIIKFDEISKIKASQGILKKANVRSASELTLQGHAYHNQAEQLDKQCILLENKLWLVQNELRHTKEEVLDYRNRAARCFLMSSHAGDLGGQEALEKLYPDVWSQQEFDFKGCE